MYWIFKLELSALCNLFCVIQHLLYACIDVPDFLTWCFLIYISSKHKLCLTKWFLPYEDSSKFMVHSFSLGRLLHEWFSGIVLFTWGCTTIFLFFILQIHSIWCIIGWVDQVPRTINSKLLIHTPYSLWVWKITFNQLGGATLQLIIFFFL